MKRPPMGFVPKTRLNISSAALVVNVNNKMFSAATPRSIRYITRRVSTLVFSASRPGQN